MNRLFIVLGIVAILVGLFWSKIRTLPLFHLPGDIVVDRPGFRFFFPITTLLIISAIVSLILWLTRRL